MILAIDPGSSLSGYVVLDKDLKPIDFGKINNEDLLDKIYGTYFMEYECRNVAIEMIASYGMAVGATVFDTCVFIGRLKEAFANVDKPNITYIYRKDEKMNLCGTMKAKDSNIRQALIDRFGVVGVKANKGWFYGVSKDVWSAIAVGVTFSDLHLKGDNNGKSI